jgi:hypothetical protein
MTNAFTLYNLSESAIQLMEMVQNGEISQEDIQETLEAMTANVEQGVKDLASVHQELAPQIDVIDVQIKRLQSRKKMLTERQAGIKRTVGAVMHAHGIKKVPSELFSVINKKGTASVEVVSQDKLPDDCISIKVTEAPNKTEIKKRLLNGDDLGGAAKLVTPEYVTQIS